MALYHADVSHFWDLIRKHSSILIVLPKNANGDVVASGLVCFSICKKITPNVDVICDGFDVPHMSFLSGHGEIKSELPVARKLSVSVNTKNNGLKNFYYDTTSDSVICYFEPRDGSFRPEDVVVGTTEYKYDLIITINTPELGDLGNVFTRATDLFYTTPIINIGITTNNAHYGQLALVDATASTIAEIFYELIVGGYPEFLTAENATGLLAGIISGTRSFRSSDVTPRTMECASALVTKGADRNGIVHHLYRNKSVSQMKLWGKALARIAYDMPRGILWTHLTKEDMEASHADRRDIEYVVSELISTAQGVLVTIVGIDSGKEEKEVVVYSNKSINILSALRVFNPIGAPNHCSVFTKEDIEQALYSILEEIRQKLPDLGNK